MIVFFLLLPRFWIWNRRAFDFQLLSDWWTAFIAGIMTEVYEQVHVLWTNLPSLEYPSSFPTLSFKSIFISVLERTYFLNYHSGVPGLRLLQLPRQWRILICAVNMEGILSPYLGRGDALFLMLNKEWNGCSSKHNFLHYSFFKFYVN